MDEVMKTKRLISAILAVLIIASCEKWFYGLAEPNYLKATLIISAGVIGGYFWNFAQRLRK